MNDSMTAIEFAMRFKAKPLNEYLEAKLFDVPNIVCQVAADL